MSEHSHLNKHAVIEAALMISGHPLTIKALLQLFSDHHDEVKASEIKEILDELEEKYNHDDSGIELKEVASGYRFQARAELSPWLHKLWAERPPRYSRALLETIAIIAYKQPVTRAEIEEIRGVTVSSNIVKTLLEREWVRVIGVKDIPGKPSIYGTTKAFLDYFNLQSLKDLPSLAEFKDIDTEDKDVQVQLALEQSNVGPSDSEQIPEESEGVVAEAEESIENENHHAQEETVSNVVNLKIEETETNTMEETDEESQEEESAETANSDI